VGKNCPYCPLKPHSPLAVAPSGRRLADLQPSSPAVPCVAWTDLAPGLLYPQSQLRVEWTCRCGRHFTRKVTHVVKRGAAFCDACRLVGKSRMEFEVAHILRRMLDTTVLTHHGVTRKHEVDLYLPEHGLAVELDPHWSHKDRLGKDVARLALRRGTYHRAIRAAVAGDRRLPQCAAALPSQDLGRGHRRAR
jgi:hypothetical protein